MSVTPIPEGGWSEEDVDREVTLLLEHGTVLSDVIIMLTYNGRTYIGPSIEVGTIVARTDYAMGAQRFVEEQQQRIRDSMEDD